MKNIIKKIQTNKLLFIILLISIVSVIFGILYLSILSKDNKTLVVESMNSFFSSIKQGKINYSKALYRSLTNNLFLDVIIWIFGISILGIPVAIFVLIFKSFVTGFTFSTIIYNYGFPGIFIAIIYILPHIINLFIIVILTYYSIGFSRMLFNYFFRKKEYNKRKIVKRYVKLLLLSFGAFIITAFIEVYVVPIILKFIMR